MVEAEDKFSFDEEFQTTVVALICRDADFLARTDGLIKPEYFTNELEAGIAAAFLGYYGKYHAVPKNRAVVTEVLKEAVAKKLIRKELVPDIPGKLKELSELTISDREYIINQIATFARHQALKSAILKSVDLLEKGKFDEVERLIKSANEVGAQDALDAYDFFARASVRRKRREDLLAGRITKNGITTGIMELDAMLYQGGWGRKELSLYMGGPKSGKTMALIDHSQAAALAGYNVLCLTLEVSAEIYEDRLDANLSEVTMSELGMRATDVEKRIADLAASGKIGRLVIHEFPSGTLQPRGISRLLSRYKSEGLTFDLIVVDYADLMAPNFRTDSLQENLRSIYIDLRAIAQTENAAVLTATQINREGIKAAVARMEHVGEDINKIRTADLVISINATEDEKACNERRLYFAASRNQEDGMSLRVKSALDRAKFIAKVIGRE